VRTRWLHPVLGFMSGFFVSAFLSALLLYWPSRAILLALLLAVASIAILRRGPGPLQRWRLAGVWFLLGFSTFTFLLAALDTLVPPTAS
jgi:hypothetical protein